MYDLENKSIGRHDPVARMRGWRMKDENDGEEEEEEED